MFRCKFMDKSEEKDGIIFSQFSNMYGTYFIVFDTDGNFHRVSMSNIKLDPNTAMILFETSITDLAKITNG